MRKKTYVIILLWVVVAICWIFIFASRHIRQTISADAPNPESIQIVFVKNSNLASMSGIEILDANNIYFRVVKDESNLINADIKVTSVIKDKKTINRVKMLHNPIKQIMVKINNKEYPAVIDTGFSGSFMINDVVIIENKLKIFPFETNEPHVAGYSWIDEVQIGDTNITNKFSFYHLGHYERQVPGKEVEKLGQVILGLKFLRQNKYLLFDNIASEIEFSLESFQAEPNEQWKQYKMSFEKDGNNTRSMVEIPIAGEKTKIIFDTGAASHLSMSQDQWEKFSVKVNVIKEKNIHFQMVHGFIDAKEKIVEELIIGERRITSAPISISNNDSFLGTDHFMLGMGCFKDTVIVLDFENNLFWVKQTTDLISNN